MSNSCVKVVVENKTLVKRNEFSRKARYYKFHINRIKFRMLVRQRADILYYGDGHICKELYAPIYIAGIVHRSYVVIRENNNNYD